MASTSVTQSSYRSSPKRDLGTPILSFDGVRFEAASSVIDLTSKDARGALSHLERRRGDGQPLYVFCQYPQGLTDPQGRALEGFRTRLSRAGKAGVEIKNSPDFFDGIVVSADSEISIRGREGLVLWVDLEKRVMGPVE